MKTFNPTTTVKTIANEKEAAEYPRKIAQEEEEDILFSRFAGQTDVEDFHRFCAVSCLYQYVHFKNKSNSCKVVTNEFTATATATTTERFNAQAYNI